MDKPALTRPGFGQNRNHGRLLVGPDACVDPPDESEFRLSTNQGRSQVPRHGLGRGVKTQDAVRIKARGSPADHLAAQRLGGHRMADQAVGRCVDHRLSGACRLLEASGTIHGVARDKRAAGAAAHRHHFACA